MISKALLSVVWLNAIGSVLQAAPTERNADAHFFEAKIRPILVRRCLKCHGEAKAQRELRVDSRKALLHGGRRGPAIVAGKPRASLLIRAIQYQDPKLKMPPSGRLPKQEVELLEKWISQGAFWPPQTKPELPRKGKHFAFQPMGNFKPPADPTGWASTPVDKFIARKLRMQSLEPSKPCDPRRLVRRVYADLLGLPPNWDDVTAFVRNPSQDAYRRLIDRLLDSPQYGERWGRHWLDLARYSDTQGGSVDCPIPSAYRYRNYVIDSFNNDLPYNEFLREQIAGDLLAKQQPSGRTRQRIIATGYLGLSLRNGIFKHYHPELIIEDTIDTIGRSMLGLSIRCARCHDHKIDPISTKDYYRLYGIFASCRYPFSGSELPQFSAGETVTFIEPDKWAALPESIRDRVVSLRGKIAETVAKHPAQKELTTKLKRFHSDIARYHAIRKLAKSDDALRTSIDDQDVRIREVIAKLDNSTRAHWNELKTLERRVGIERLYAMREEKPHDVHVQIYGDPFDPGPVVKRGLPKVLERDRPLVISDRTSGRLELADWLAGNSNPLTPRVAVNYIWQFHFGRGLVPTSDDFGLGGQAPTHPELLDWLGRDFVRHGWSVKHLHRRIMLSKTYQMASELLAKQNERDPSNRWYWRFDRRRLDAEAIRDSMMSVAGTLQMNRPGAHPFPAESTWKFSQHGPFKAVYRTSHRSVYLMTQRIQAHPFLSLFDGPDTSRTTFSRRTSSTALQALFLKNSAFVHDQARSLAKGLIKQHSDSRARVTAAVRATWNRDPSPREIDDALSYIELATRQLKKQQRESQTAKARLLLQYKFEGNLHDTSSGKGRGKLHGDPTFVPGVRGKGISLDGEGDYVDTGLKLGSAHESFVVECWVRPRARQNVYTEIFGNHLGGGRGFVLQQHGNLTNRYRTSIGIGGDNWRLGTPFHLKPGAWHKLAMVKHRGTVQVYLNDKRIDDYPIRAPIVYSDLTFRIGIGLTLVDRSFNGDIDELSVYAGVPKRYQQRDEAVSLELASWSSYAKLLLTANEFLYID